MKRTRGTLLFYAWLGAFAVALAAMPLSRSIQGALMDAQHLTPTSLPAWAAAQLTPKMYAFANDAWTADAPLTPELRTAPPGPPYYVDHLWMNHYPGRSAFEMTRGDLASRGIPAHTLARSRYRGMVRETAFVTTIDGGRLVIRREEPGPR